MSLENRTIQTIEGSSLNECKLKLREMYGDDFEIKERQSKIKSYGFLHLKQKEVQVVSYVVNHSKAYDDNTYSNNTREKEQEQFDTQAFLQAQNNVIVNTALNTITSKIEEMGKQISTINTNLNSATGEVHETIRRIEELLEQN